jgi:multidrug efflux pump subunit AcrA (membrane-fusion protein)
MINDPRDFDQTAAEIPIVTPEPPIVVPQPEVPAPEPATAAPAPVDPIPVFLVPPVAAPVDPTAAKEPVPGGQYLNRDGLIVDANGFTQAELQAQKDAAAIKLKADEEVARIHADIATQAALAREQASQAEAAAHAQATADSQAAQ